MADKAYYNRLSYQRNKDDISERRKANRNDATREKERQYRKDNPEIFQDIWLRYAYGIDSAQKEQILKRQGGRCAICRSPDPKSKRGWHVDHDHATKKVRGLLCRSCNVGIGRFRDDPELLRAALQYLTQSYDSEE